MRLHLFSLTILLSACQRAERHAPSPASAVPSVAAAAANPRPIPPPTLSAACPESDGFDFPVGPPDARGYYNAQVFGANNHLGDDWNGTGGGNSDKGDPIHAIANGIVVSAFEGGPGWGNVVRILHRVDGPDAGWVESLDAHLDTMNVRQAQVVRRGQKVGTMGDAGGRYYAHLHFEIRTRPGLPLGGGYARDARGHTDPTAFIRAHRPRPAKRTSGRRRRTRPPPQW